MEVEKGLWNNVMISDTSRRRQSFAGLRERRRFLWSRRKTVHCSGALWPTPCSFSVVSLTHSERVLSWRDCVVEGECFVYEIQRSCTYLRTYIPIHLFMESHRDRVVTAFDARVKTVDKVGLRCCESQSESCDADIATAERQSGCVTQQTRTLSALRNNDEHESR